MKILVIGGTGTIGKAVVHELRKEHEVVSVGRSSGDYNADLEQKKSIEELFEKVKDLDGVISLAGDAEMAPYYLQSDDQIDLAINSKLRGNIDLIRVSTKHLNKGGFILITTGLASVEFMPNASSVSMALAGLEGYIQSIQLEKYNEIEVKAIRPMIITETMKAFNLDLPFSLSAQETGVIYKKVIESRGSEAIVNVSDYVKL